MECISCHSRLLEDAAYCPRCGVHQPDAPAYSEHDYAAFISYRHRSPDADVAKRLHRAIETYRLPKDVAFSYGARKLGRVFRDQDELPATGSLPDSIRDALKRSASLVVVCSPATPGSRWVEQELELFASYHGRERIFAALAEGASSESLPDLLRYCTHVAADGTAEQIASEPLAADMRAQNRKNFNSEKLRVIAGMAGCGYDELRRRDKTRRTRRTVASVAAAAAVIAAVVGLGTFAADRHRLAQTEESQRLAVQAQQLLESGDRYGAIETALEALPASSSDTSRPLVGEAQKALSDALEIPPYDSPWRSGFSIETQNTLGLINGENMYHPADTLDAKTSSIAVCRDGGYFVVSDNEGAISAHALDTGKRLFTCDLSASRAETESPVDPADADLYNRFIETSKDHFVVSDAARKQIACFAVPSGDVLWSHDSYALACISASFDGSVLDAAEFVPGKGVGAASIDMETGEFTALASLNDEKLPPLGKGVCSVMGDCVSDFYAAAGDRLMAIDLSSGKAKTAQLSYPSIRSLSQRNGTVIACTLEDYDGENLELRYRVEAFDENLAKLWEFKGKATSEMIDEGHGVSLIQGAPCVQGYLSDEKSLVLSAGRNVYVLDLKSGKKLYEHGFASTVLDVLSWTKGEKSANRLFIATADGTIAMENPESPTRNYDGDEFRYHLGFSLRWSSVTLHDNTFTWLSVPANEAKRIVAFRTDLTYGGEPEHEYSLDELVQLAHETLEER